MVKVLFVCSGNICRSPMAEGAFRQLVSNEGLEESFQIDSAGIGSWHLGEAPDRRAQIVVRARGGDLSELRARRVTLEDFSHFDHVLAMDEENYEALTRLCPPGQEHRVARFMDYAPESNHREVPDPYYGHLRDFETALDLIEAASRGLLADIRANGL